MFKHFWSASKITIVRGFYIFSPFLKTISLLLRTFFKENFDLIQGRVIMASIRCIKIHLKAPKIRNEVNGKQDSQLLKVSLLFVWIIRLFQKGKKLLNYHTFDDFASSYALWTFISTITKTWAKAFVKLLSQVCLMTCMTISDANLTNTITILIHAARIALI